MMVRVPFWKRSRSCSPFESVMEPHLERLWRLALRLQNGKPDQAEDLMQDLFVRAWRHRGKIGNLKAPGAWLARVLYRLHVDRWRRRGALGEAVPIETADEPAADVSGSGMHPVLVSATAHEVLEVVNNLPEHQRIPLLMHDAEGYTLTEISQILHVPTGTLKSRLHRARAAVRIRISKGTVSPAGACSASGDAVRGPT